MMEEKRRRGQESAAKEEEVMERKKVLTAIKVHIYTRIYCTKLLHIFNVCVRTSGGMYMLVFVCVCVI